MLGICLIVCPEVKPFGVYWCNESMGENYQYASVAVCFGYLNCINLENCIICLVQLMVMYVRAVHLSFLH
jgi:hypothetical protein